MVSLAVTNSRMKDLYDVRWLASARPRSKKKVQPTSDSAGLSEAVHTMRGVGTGEHPCGHSLLEAE
jgi:hypothetical protein